MKRNFYKKGSFNDIDPLKFEQKEKLLRKGLHLYLTNMIGEYLEDFEINTLEEMLVRFRYRPADVVFSDELCSVVSYASEIRNRKMPRKALRKDEFSILLYNVSPYALLGRKYAAMMAKKAFPNFFASVSTINSTFTKYQGSAITQSGNPVSLTISNLQFHSQEDFESLLIYLTVNIVENDPQEPQEI